MNQAIARQTYSAPSLPGRAITDIIDWCMSASERPAQEGYKLYLRNMPNQADRQVLAARARDVLAALKQHDRKEIALAVMDMLASYDVAQAKQLTAAERKVAVAVYVRELHGVPTWAVIQACDRIRLGSAPDISHSFKPTPIQVRVLAVQIAQPWKQEALQIGEILGAPEYREGPSEEERGRVGVLMRELVTAMKGGELRDEGLMAKLSEEDRLRDEALLRSIAEHSRKNIERAYADLGIPPLKAGDMLVSPALAKLIEEQNQKYKAMGPSSEDLGS